SRPPWRPSAAASGRPPSWIALRRAFRMRKRAPSPNGSRPGRSMVNRRTVVAGLAAGIAALLAAPRVLAQTPPHVAVVGGGFAGASAARALKRQGADIRVTLVEPKARYAACPFSNAVLAGLRDLDAQYFGYD